jgi:hypothetical protein
MSIFALEERKKAVCDSFQHLKTISELKTAKPSTLRVSFFGFSCSDILVFTGK